MEILIDRLVNYGTVALGLGFVIFIHELGHFLLAKWNGVKVEIFALGLPLGPTLISYRRGLGVRLGSTLREYNRRRAAAEEAGKDPDDLALGETEYAITSVPLGGFVKMLGEGEAVDPDAPPTTDPRAYSNKPVGARMAIISAGVIMNLISGLLLFMIVYGQGGLPVIPARIGAVSAGQPAYVAGLRPGDRVVALNGRRDIDFIAMQRMTAMSGPGQVLHLEVERPGVVAPLKIDVEPHREGKFETKKIGISPSNDLALAEPPFVPPAGMTGGEALASSLRVDDKIFAVGPEGEQPQPVTDAIALEQLLTRYRDRPLVLELKRGAGEKSTPVETFRVTLPTVPMLDFGFRLTTGPIVAIQPDSPAARAGLKVNDRIVGVEGLETVDPMRLPEVFADRAGKPVSIQVVRAKGDKPDEQLTLTVEPVAAPVVTQPSLPAEPLNVPSLGLALAVVPKIAAIRPDSPASRAGLVEGDTITSLKVTPRTFDPGDKVEARTFEFDGQEASWSSAFLAVQLQDRQPILLGVQGRKEPLSLTPEPDPTWWNPDRGLILQRLQHPMPPLGVAAAIRHGFEDTLDTILSIYQMFRNLILREISPKAIGGPLRIADIASKMARAGLVTFLQFLGVLSLNLAVINFLPIPPLDGGQMLFLVAEKIRNRPLPEKAVSAGMILGVIFVLGLIGLVMFLDITWLRGG